jgi:hypothetical protein
MVRKGVITMDMACKTVGASAANVDVVRINQRLLASSPKSDLAVLAARIREGSVLPQFSIALLAQLFRVSPTYVNEALRLSEEERNAVELKERPLVPPRSADAGANATIARLVQHFGAEKVFEALIQAM